jgi:hypothetical protein
MEQSSHEPNEYPDELGAGALLRNLALVNV